RVWLDAGANLNREQHLRDELIEPAQAAIEHLARAAVHSHLAAPRDLEREPRARDGVPQLVRQKADARGHVVVSLLERLAPELLERRGDRGVDTLIEDVILARG